MPHIMKKSVIIIISLLALSFAWQACNKVYSDYTPYIKYSDFYVNPIRNSHDSIIGAKDTLMATWKDSRYLLDTISVNDTVYFGVAFGSYSNNLLGALITFDSTQLAFTLELDKSIKEALLPESDVKNGQLKFQSGYNLVTFPVWYRPLKPGTFDLQFTVESDSKSSPVTYFFRQPVK